MIINNRIKLYSYKKVNRYKLRLDIDFDLIAVKNVAKHQSLPAI